MRRPFMDKLDSGEFITKWNGYSSFYAGNFYGSSLKLGGEEKFEHCYDFFSGIGDVDWWIKSELDALSIEDQNELLAILKRNKEFYECTQRIAKPLAEALGVEHYQIHRLDAKDLFAFVTLVNSKANKKYEAPVAPIDGFKVGDVVIMPDGREGTITCVYDSAEGPIDVAHPWIHGGVEIFWPSQLNLKDKHV